MGILSLTTKLVAELDEAESDLPIFEARRIVCEACSRPFSYLYQGSDRLNEPSRGVGICPHCHRYQPWMVRNSLIDGLCRAAIIGPAIGVLAGVAGVVALMNTFAPLVFGPIVSTVIVFLLTYGLRLKEGPHPEKSIGESMTDKQLRKLQRTAAANRRDVCSQWVRELRLVSGGIHSLGLKDRVSS